MAIKVSGKEKNRNDRLAFTRRERGAVAIYVALIIAVLFGMVGLTIDFSRFLITHTQAQDAADAAALAAAAQLDGHPKAIVRATRAAIGSPLTANYQALVGSGGTVTIAAPLRFFTSLPDDSVDPIPANYSGVTINPTEARFVEVTTEGLQHENWFLLAVGAIPTAIVRGHAIAGYSQQMCRIPPLMMCNPWDTGNGEDFDSDKLRGSMVLLKKLAGSSWFPGGFGFLDPPESEFDHNSENGAKALAEEIATSSPQFCYGNSVAIKTGETVAVHTAFNVRFDIYENPFFGGNARNNPEFRPALNVTKGRLRDVNPSCSNLEAAPPGPPPAAMALPRDDCLLPPETPAGCPIDPGQDPEMAFRVGNGVWDFQGYWDVNHPALGYPDLDEDGTPDNVDPTPPSRFEVYRWEIENNQITNGAYPNGESGAPQCYGGGTVTDDPDRRTLQMAVINCKTLGLTGKSVKDVPVLTVLKVFMTEPACWPGDPLPCTAGEIVIEVVEEEGEKAEREEVFHDIVQLYR